MVVDPLASRGVAVEPPRTATLARLAAAGIAVKSARLVDLTTAGTVATGHTDPADWAGLTSAGARNPSGVPGIQIDGYFPDTSTGNTTRGWNHDAQFVLRLPERWNGGLVVADAAVSGTPPLHTIEVELTPKHLAKLQQVFEHRYPGDVQTTYFTPAGHQDGLRRRLAVLEQATRARNEPWSQVNVVPLPDLPGLSYEGAA